MYRWGVRSIQTRPCADCGESTTKRPHGGRPFLCQGCSTRRTVVGARQMAAKSGPAWDRYRIGWNRGMALRYGKTKEQ